MEESVKKPNITFNDFLDFFPEVELPVAFNEETLRDFSNTNQPLPALAIEQFITPYEDELPDELTEFIACCRIPETHSFQAVVYWKAGLMTYEFTLATYTKQGILLDKRVIAGTFFDGERLTQSVAIIEDDWEILVMSGQTTADENNKFYDAQQSRVTKMELLPEGQIIDLE
ncbi:MAG: hypothetical protein ACK4TA_01535 [Saprospiraceae bacterium]